MGQGGGKTRNPKIGFLVTKIWKMLISPIHVQDELGESGSKMSLEMAFFKFGASKYSLTVRSLLFSSLEVPRLHHLILIDFIRLEQRRNIL